MQNPIWQCHFLGVVHCNHSRQCGQDTDFLGVFEHQLFEGNVTKGKGPWDSFVGDGHFGGHTQTTREAKDTMETHTTHPHCPHANTNIEGGHLGKEMEGGREGTHK